MNDDSKFLCGTFSNKENVRAQSNLEEKGNPSISQDDSLRRRNSSNFTLLTSELFEPLKCSD